MAIVKKETLERIFENYAMLPDEDCAFVLQNFLLEALESDTIFEWELAGKLMALSDAAREVFTKSLNRAIKGSLQQIGGKSVAAWILEYLKKYDGIARTPNTFFEFCSRSPEIQKLARRDQIKLMRIFRMYDYFMVEPIMDLEAPVDQIFRFPMRLDSTPAEIAAQVRAAPPAEAMTTPRTITEKMPLRELLKKYPSVGEQMITGGQLKLAHFDRPVRPSIRNWLYDYTSQLGQERHDSMQRMKYLFSSENGKVLSSPDREKLGIILKSFDESVPLPVDAGRNEILFDNLEVRGEKLEMRDKKSLAPSMQQIVPRQKTSQETFIKPYPKPGAYEPQPQKSAENISNIHFAEGLPKPRKSIPQPNLPVQPQTKSIIPPKISFARPRKNIIEPIGRPRPEPKIEGNIVDLSEKDS